MVGRNEHVVAAPERGDRPVERDAAKVECVRSVGTLLQRADRSADTTGGGPGVTANAEYKLARRATAVRDESHVAAEDERWRHQRERQRGHRDAVDAWDREQIGEWDRPEPGRREQRQRGHLRATLGDRGCDRATERMSNERNGIESEPFDSLHDVIGVGGDQVFAWRLRAAEAGQVKSNTRTMRARDQSFPAGGRVEHAVEQDKQTFKEQIVTQVTLFDQMKEQVGLTAEADSIAGEKYEIAKQRYVLGNLSITDLSIAFQENDQAKRDYVAALRDFWGAYYQLRYLSLYDFEKNEKITYK